MHTTDPTDPNYAGGDPYELAWPRVIEAVAQGASKSETRLWLMRVYPGLSPDARTALLRDALDDALSCGIEREDVDPSWFAGSDDPVQEVSATLVYA